MMVRLSSFTLTLVSLVVSSSSASVPIDSSSGSKNQTRNPQDDVNYQDPKTCHNLPPSLAKMEMGVDLTSLDFFPPDLRSPAGFTRPIFYFTCDEKKKWTHPDLKDQEFTLPDQILLIEKVPYGSLKTKTSFNQEIDDLKKSMSAKVGLDLDGKIGSFSASASYQDAKNKMMQSNRSIAEVAASIALYNANLRISDITRFSSSFIFDLSQLPTSYEKGPREFENFINLYGTHYFGSAKFGGNLYEQTIIENSYLETTDSRDIRGNLKLSFQAFAGVSIGGNASIELVDNSSKSSFDKNSQINFYAFGGDTDFFKTKAEQETNQTKLLNWWATVLEKPWLIGGHLSPIENLIQDPGVRAGVKKASAIKLSKATLNELMDDCKTLSIVDCETELNSLMQRLRKKTITLQEINNEIVPEIKKKLEISRFESNKARGSPQLSDEARKLELPYDYFRKTLISWNCADGKNEDDFLPKDGSPQKCADSYMIFGPEKSYCVYSNV